MKKMRKFMAFFALGALMITLFSACGDQATTGLEFTPMEDGTFSVTGYTGTKPHVVIPAKHNGIKVTVISEEAFAESSVQSVSGGKNIVKLT